MLLENVEDDERCTMNNVRLNETPTIHKDINKSRITSQLIRFRRRSLVVVVAVLLWFDMTVNSIVGWYSLEEDGLVVCELGLVVVVIVVCVLLLS